jgi:hypothetical protein
MVICAYAQDCNNPLLMAKNNENMPDTVLTTPEKASADIKICT